MRDGLCDMEAGEGYSSPFLIEVCVDYYVPISLFFCLKPYVCSSQIGELVDNSTGYESGSMSLNIIS